MKTRQQRPNKKQNTGAQIKEKSQNPPRVIKYKSINFDSRYP